MSDLTRFQHPRFARMYERISAESEQRGSADHRREMLADAAGRVVEVGAGNGLNFGHYPPEVVHVTAVEPDDSLRGRATRAAGGATVPVEVLAGHADRLPAEDESVDVVVASLVLCSVPDQGSALAEMRRILKPGGQLRYYEHVRSASRVRALLEDLITPLWSRAGGGCHPNRRTSDAVRRAGFRIDSERRFPFRPMRLGLSSDHVIGVATKS